MRCLNARAGYLPDDVLRGGEVTFEKELSYNYSYFLKRNLGTLFTLLTVTTIKTWPKK